MGPIEPSNGKGKTGFTEDAKASTAPSLTSAVTTSIRDNHSPPGMLSNPSTPSASKFASSNEDNPRNHKRDSLGAEIVEKTPEAQAKFTIGKSVSLKPKAKKKLDLEAKVGTGRGRTRQKNVDFSKRGFLSPSKNRGSNLDEQRDEDKGRVSREASPAKKVLFEKKGSLSPKKSVPDPEEFNKDVANVRRALTSKKMTPAQIKAKLGQTGKLADLKERMAKLSNLKISPRSHHSSAIIMSPVKDAVVPRLGGGKGMSLDVVIPLSPSKMKSPLKASPRKKTVEKTLDLRDDDNSNLPIPKSYKFLEEIFRTVDHLVSIKFNRREIVKVADLKRNVQTALRKNFSESYLRKIRCVFPQAFHYVWEHITGKFGIKKEDYELTVWPNMKYADDLRNGTEAPSVFNPAQLETLSTKGLVERRRLFRRLLVSMVRDHHRNFLANLDPPIELDEAKLKRWHKMFDVESCPDVDMTPLPPKPDVVKITKASEVLTAKRDLFGINSRLENALK